MEDYNIDKGTVTITIDKFRDLVFDSTCLHCLQRHGVGHWEGYDKAMNAFFNNHDFSFDELTVTALAIMQDEERDDYELMVASEWLHYLPLCRKMEAAEWAAIMRDLEDQLKAIIDEKEND